MNFVITSELIKGFAGLKMLFATNSAKVGYLIGSANSAGFLSEGVNLAMICDANLSWQISI